MPTVFTNSATVTLTGSAITTATDMWVTWNADCITTSAGLTWQHWNAGSSICANNLPADNVIPWGSYAPPTEAQQAVAAERRALALEAKKEAKTKALALLRSMLDLRQLRELDEHQRFTVVSTLSGRRYRVKTNEGIHGNVYEVDERGVELCSVCCAPGGGLPQEDAFLAQALWLEHAEEEFLRVGNTYNLRAA